MMSMSLYRRRRRRNAVAMTLAVAATAFGAMWLVLILATLIWNGASGLSLEVFTADTPPPGSAGSGRNGCVAFEVTHSRQVNAVEDHLELARGQFQSGLVRRGVGEVVTAGFQTLAPQAQAVPAPVQDLEAVGRPVADPDRGDSAPRRTGQPMPRSPPMPPDRRADRWPLSPVEVVRTNLHPFGNRGTPPPFPPR